MDICDLDNNGRNEIIIIACHLYYFPTQLVILDEKGKILGEYWNSGHFNDYVFVDLNNDGRKEIILGGINNEYRKPCIVVFDSTIVKGSSPQSGYYKCNEFERGSEKYYILLPRTDVDLLEALLAGINRVDILKNRRLSFETRYSNIYFEFNYNFELQNIDFSNYFIQKHKLLVLEGKVKTKLNEKYKEKLAQNILYYDGNGWPL